MKPDYTYNIIEGTLCIVDLNLGNMSVSNGAEEVLREIHKDISLDLPIIYRDSEGNWDGLDYKDHVTSFYPLNTTKQSVGIRRAKERWFNIKRGVKK